jgi:hypothetical protein
MAIAVRNWARKNTFKIHSVAFVLMIVPAALLYPAGASQSMGWIWFLIGLVVTGNILVLLVR